MLSLYDRKNTYFVIGGILLYHLLVVGLCSFWAYKFLYITYVPGVILLISMFILLTTICDVLLYRFQLIDRFLIRICVGHRGMHCTLLWKKWCIEWDDICLFGITGFSNSYGMVLGFFSCDSHERYNKEKITEISRARIVFQVNKSRWELLSHYLPIDIQSKMDKALESKQDCYYRRR